MTMRRLRSMSAIVFLVVGLSWGAPASGQSAEQEIAARLIGRPLYLQGLWAGDDIKFKADGQPETATEMVPFTEAGIDVTSVTLKDGELMIEGQRMALEFVSTDTIERVPAKARHYNGRMRLEIESDASGDYSKALDAIFTSDLTKLIPSLPPYWQSYAKDHFCKLMLVKQKSKEKKHNKVAADSTALNATGQATGESPSVPTCWDGPMPASAADGRPKAKAKHVGGSVKPPKVLKSFDPSYTPLARALGYSGKVEVYFIVGSDGSVSHVSIVRPVGLGLDEVAAATAEKYRFAPATQDGNPVAVDLYMDVNFQIF